MSTSTLASPAVAEFATAVRSALSDLAPDEIDELTDGLEADLTDRLSDTDAAELGDPRAYAEELRAAAGLPHRPVARAGFAAELAELRHAPQIVAAAFREFGAEHPWLGRVRDFFVALRPAWWVFRAAVITALIVNLTSPGWWAPINIVNVAIATAALVLSVQFGRGKWLPRAWMRGVLLVINVALVLCAPFILVAAAASVNNGWYSAQYAVESTPDLSSTGLLENGNQVTNIFAYDAQGNPIKDVQLYDQDGKPLNLIGDSRSASVDLGSGLLVPNQHVPGRLGWNVFPLGHVASRDVNGDGSLKHSVTPKPARPPFAAATPLAGSGGATALPTPAPTIAPTPTPTPTPTPAPTP